MLEDVYSVRHTFLETIVPPPFLGHSIATLFLYLLNQNLSVSILQAIAETGGEYIQAYTSGGHVSVFRFVRLQGCVEMGNRGSGNANAGTKGS